MKVRILSALLVAFLLCGCATSVQTIKPELDPALAQEVKEEIQGTQRLFRAETFQNADGSA